MDIGIDTPIGLCGGANLFWEPPPSVLPCGVVTLATGTQWVHGWWLAQEGLEVGTRTAREKKMLSHSPGSWPETYVGNLVLHLSLQEWGSLEVW